MLGTAAAMAAGPFIGMSAAQAAPAPTSHTVFVTPSGDDGKAFDQGHRGAVYHSINAAVTAVAPGGTVVVEAGTYHEDVALNKTVRLEGTRGAIIDAGNQINGVKVTAPHVTVSGLDIKNATGEGVLVENTSYATIEGNNVHNNDLGVSLTDPVATTYTFCQPLAPGVANDCGEGIHLLGSSHNLIKDNHVTSNSGGVLSSDETGPTSHNVIMGNYVADNQTACGIVMAGHNPMAAPGGTPASTVAGVFDNTVKGNTILRNGLKGGGAGVQMASAVPGGAVYGNTVIDNTIDGNGHAGVTEHSHAPGQDLNGNEVIGNKIGTNNLNGDTDFPPGDPRTTGVLVGTASPVSITIRGNAISDNHFGVFTTGPVTATGEDDNVFHHVDVGVSAN